MSVGLREKLAAARKECALHAAILREDLVEHGTVRYDAKRIDELSRSQLRLLDQMAYRFGKLQSTLGERVMPLLLEMAEEPLAPETTFAQKLQRLERLGLIPSAEDWRMLRQTRNAIAHEYPEAPAIRAALLNHFVGSVAQLLGFWDHIHTRWPA